MDFTIRPLKGANDIEFGMQAEVVQALMGAVPQKFRRHDEAFPSDHFVEDGVFGYYDADGHLEAMEFSAPSRALLGAVDFLQLPFGEAASLLRQIDPEAETNKDMVTSKRFSIAIWSSAGFDEADEPVEAFLIGRPGYYDTLGEPK